MAARTPKGLTEVPPGTSCDIVGAEEVWAAGGRVYIAPIEPDPATGQKYSTTAILAKLKELYASGHSRQEVPHS